MADAASEALSVPSVASESAAVAGADAGADAGVADATGTGADAGADAGSEAVDGACCAAPSEGRREMRSLPQPSDKLLESAPFDSGDETSPPF